MKKTKLTSQLSFLAALTLGATSGLRADESAVTAFTDETFVQVGEAEVGSATDVVEPSDLGELVSEGEAEVIDQPEIAECSPTGGIYYFGGFHGEFQPDVKEIDESATAEVDEQPEVVTGEDLGENSDLLEFKGETPESEVSDELNDGELGEIPLVDGAGDEVTADDEIATPGEEDIAFDDVIFHTGWHHLAGPHPYFRGQVDFNHEEVDGESFGLAADHGVAGAGIDLAADSFTHHAVHGRGHFFAHAKFQDDMAADEDSETAVQGDDNESTVDSGAIAETAENAEIENIEPAIDVAEVPAAFEEDGRVFLK